MNQRVNLKEVNKEKSELNIRNKKGITLIALVVTIVVLLILAGITISTLFGENGIINAARRAEQETANAENTTNEGLKSLQGQMADKLSDGNWKDNGNGTFTSGSKTVTIGDYVTYDPGNYTHTPDTSKGAGTSYISGGGDDTPVVLATSQLTTQTNFTSWRVLGVNIKGQLELISSNPTTQELYLANDTGYLNAEDNLNKYCDELYGKGENVTGARSLNADDIDKLAKYDKTKYANSNGDKYGTKYQYQFPSSGDYLQYRKKETATNASWSSWSNISMIGEIYAKYQKFRMPGSTTIINSSNSGQSPELEHTSYSYNIEKEITTADGYTSELATKISDMIKYNKKHQWLASCCIDCYSGYTLFNIYHVIGNNLTYYNLFHSYENYISKDCCVRPVVTLQSGVKLTGTGANLGTASNPYTLSK